MISLYSFNQPDRRIKFYAGWVNLRKLQVPAFAGRARDEKFFARQLSVESKHMNLTSSKIAKHVGVLKLFASIALRIVRLQ